MLKGTRVILKPPEREYIDYFLKWMNDIEITQYLKMFRPLTRDMEEEWFDKLKNREDFFLFSIFILQETNRERIIGNCSINVDWKNRVGTCGIVIGEKDCLSKGYGTEAMKLLIDYSFNTLNLNKVELDTYEFNIRAYKSYKKAGFIEEGRRRQAIYVNGKYHDRIILGILKDEWQEKKKNE
jgi:RimJ/RimL family protein N-acetyltransferase